MARQRRTTKRRSRPGLAERDLAYHEAGHCVMGWHLGMPSRDLCVVDGHVAWLPDRLARDTGHDLIRLWVMVSLAGRVAQRLRRRPRQAAVPRIRATVRASAVLRAEAALRAQDLQWMASLGFQLMDQRAMEYWIPYLECQVERELRQNWGVVQGVAEELLGARTLSGQSARAVIERVRPDRKTDRS